MKKRHKKVALLISISAIICAFASIHIALNSVALQKIILHVLSSGPVQIQTGGIKFSLLSNSISIKDLDIKSSKTDQKLHVNNISLKYSFKSFIRGKLILPHVTVSGLDASIQKQETEKKEKISIKKLFLLQSIVIDEGLIQDARFNFNNQATLVADTLSLQFQQGFKGDVALDLNLQGVNLNANGSDTSLGGFSLKGRTKITDWTDTPPYVSSIKGHLRLTDLNLEKLRIASLAADLKAENGRLELANFEIVKDGQPLRGFFEVDFASKIYKANIKIDKLMDFPRLGGSNPTFDTSGKISGELTLEGSGLELQKTSGSARLNFTHAKGDLSSVVLTSNPVWKNGIVELKDTAITLDNGKIKAEGFVNIGTKKFDISFDGHDVPLKAVFGRFSDIHFHPIFGNADARARLSGWAKDFRVTGKADTIGEGGYYYITTDHAHATIDATYQELNLIGQIDQNGKKTGDIVLKIKYGAKIPGQPRPKNIHLEANVQNNDLGRSFKAYNLSGIGNASLVLNGPQRTYNGKVHAAISNGSFADIAFQNVSVNAEMGYKKIKFTDGELTLPNMQPVPFTSPINMNFTDDGFRLEGHPISDIAFDASFNTKQGSWQVRELLYHTLKANGSYAPKGAINLFINGEVDAATLAIFKQFLRESSGNLKTSLRLTGPAADPSINGTVTFYGNTIYPRNLNVRMEDLLGELKFDGHSIGSEHIAGTIEGGDFIASGTISHRNKVLDKYDITFRGNNLRYSLPDRSFRIEFDSDVTWKGSSTNSMLKGEITILDGKYTKDFTFLEGLGHDQDEKKSSAFLGTDSTHIDLHIRNAGDLAIRNNIGDIWLRLDVNATGTALHPVIAGTIETTEGKIHYLGRDFIITKGYIEFRAPYTLPYLEIVAEHEVTNIPDLVIIATLHGRTDNLTLELSSTKALEKRDIVSLLIFGVTEQEMRDSQWSTGLGPQVIASQVTHLIERPVTKFAHLDIFRLEASGDTNTANSAAPGTQISKIYMGKQLTDRLSLEFLTDINTEDAQQTLRGEYLLTDFLLLKGEKSSAQRYKLNMSLRFKER